MKTFLTPGPSQLYFTYDYHLKNALKNNVPSISHRSQQFKDIYQETVFQLKTLLSMPENFHIAFTASATEIWERIIQNQVESNSLHYVNGAFAKKFSEIASELGRNPITVEGSQEGFDLSINQNTEPELVAITQNETSIGYSFPVEEIELVRKQFPNSLVAVDGVSSIPHPEFNFEHFDHLYFSVQKCFGLPAGLGVWIYNDRALDKAELLSQKGSIGSYHSLLKLHAQTIKFQTPETPNILNIYLLGKIAEDMNNKGLDMIRRETNYKYALINHLVTNHESLKPFIAKENYRSKTVFVAECTSPSAVISKMAEKGFVLGSGYGKYKDSHIRIANFPTISKERMEMMVDILEKVNPQK